MEHASSEPRYVMRWLLLCAMCCALNASVVFSVRPLLAQGSQNANSLERRAYERYLKVLERRPRQGAALDKIYDFHVTAGTLEEFVDQLQQQSQADAADGTAALILGMVEMRRGRDAAAIDGLQQAAAKRANDPIPAWYLGQVHATLGDTSAAAQALEQALQRQPAAVDQVQIFELLGRTYQRAHRTQDALNLWTRFEAEFPEDDTIREQIAGILLQEGDLQAALPKYELLAESVRDPFKRTEFSIIAADLKLQLGQQDAAVADFEQILNRLKSDSWQWQDVRRRIETAFLRNQNRLGLIEWYQNWLQQHPGDLAAMEAVGRQLAAEGQAARAVEWLQQAVAKAPTNSALRQALVDLLVDQGDVPAALQQYRELSRNTTVTAEVRERWGHLWLLNESVSASERQTQAAAIWNQLLTAADSDPVMVRRVAELYRSADLPEQAVSLYQQAIELAPEQPEYREYLGEYLHQQKRTDEALQAWQQIASGPRRSAANLVRLSEVLQNFGFELQSLTALQEACRMDAPLTDHLRLVAMLRDAARYDDAQQQLDAAERLSRTADERQLVQEQRLQTYIAAGQIQQRIQQLKQALEEGKSTSVDQWQQLAEYQEAAGQLQQASRSIRKALEQNPDGVATWEIAARIYEKSGLLQDAASAYTKLAVLDRRQNVAHLRQVCALQQQLGLADAALQTADAVLQAAPDNPDAYRFYADVCFQLGRPEQAAEVLRKSVRVNPGDVDNLMLLAETLADQFRTDEALEFYWKAFQQSDIADQQTSIVQRLTSLYLRTNRFQNLLDRLETVVRSTDDSERLLRFTAAAYQAAGDLVNAQATLERLLVRGPAKADLLKELSAVAEQAQNLPAAIQYQQQLLAVQPSTQATSRLADLLLRSEQWEDAEAVLQSLKDTAADPQSLLPVLDQLIATAKLDAARRLADRLLLRDAANADLLLRQAVVAFRQSRFEDVDRWCERLLAVPVAATSTAAQRKSNSESTPSAAASSFPDSPLTRTDVAMHVLYDLNLVPALPERLRDGRAGRVPWQFQHPQQARTTAVALQLQVAKRQNQLHEQLSRWHQQAVERSSAVSNGKNGTDSSAVASASDSAISTGNIGSPVSSSQAAWDFYDAVATTDQWSKWQSQVADIFATVPTPEAQYLFLHTLLNHRESPLTPEQGQQLIVAWQAVSRQHADWLTEAGTADRLLKTLQQANLITEAQQLQENLTDENATASELRAAFEMAVAKFDAQAVLQLAGRVIAAERANSPAAAGRHTTLGNLGRTFAQLASREAAQDRFDVIADLLTEFLRIKTSAFENRIRKPLDLPEISEHVVTNSHRMFQNGQQTNSLRVTTLPPDQHYEFADVTFLVNLHALYNESRRPQLLDVVQKYQQTANTDTAHIMADLALAHLYTLQRDHDQAAVHVVRAAERDPQDAFLRLNLARFYQQTGNNRDALALLETIPALDHNVMRQRELLALKLATESGNSDRARLAAERLFGLRLDSGTSLKLAAQMQTLGMEAQAATVLNRTRRTSGNELSTLLSLMQQYAIREDTDIANQIAIQILQQTDTGTRRSAAADAARTDAIQQLGKTDQLETQIIRAEQQLQASASPAQMRTLIEFYKAAGRDEDAIQMAAKLNQQQPESIDNLLRLAGQYERSRNYDAACNYYLQVLKRDPQRFTQNYYQYLKTFRNAGRLPDLTDVILTHDLRKLQNNYFVVSELMEYLFHEVTTGNDADQRHQNKGLELLAAAWAAFPNERSYLLNNIRAPQIWNRAEMFRYAKEGLLPATVQQAIARPWQGIADAPAFSSKGEIIGTLSRILRALPDQQRLHELTQQVNDVVTEFEMWPGGRLILSVLQARAGDLPAAEQQLQMVLQDPQLETLPPHAAWLIGAELQKHGERFLPQITQLLEQSLTRGKLHADQGFDYAPGRRLADLYAMQKRTADARVTIHKTIDAQLSSRSAVSEPGQQAWQQITDFSAAAAKLAALNFPLDAIAMYQRLTPELLTDAERYKTDGSVRRIGLTCESASCTLRENASVPAVKEFLQRAGQASDGFKQPSTSAQKDSAADKQLNLMLTDVPLSSPIRVEHSVLLSVLQRLAADASAAAQFSSVLQPLVDASPARTSAAVAAFVVAESAADSELREQSVQTLLQVSNAGQDNPPNPQDVAVWYVARTLLAQPDMQVQGQQLAAFAEAAAQATQQTHWLQAMLEARGHLALKAGDRQAAEQAWSRQLDAVLMGTEASTTASEIPMSSGSAVQEVRQRLLKNAAPATGSE